MRRRGIPCAAALPFLLLLLLLLLLCVAGGAAASCPYDIDGATRIIPTGCYANATAATTGCCWYVFASYMYAAIRYANLTGTAFLPEATARTCTTDFSSYAVRQGLVVPSLLLSGDRCNLAGDPIKFAAGSRPCQFSKISDVFSAVDLSNGTRLCTATRRNLTDDQFSCVACQNAVIAATFALFDATRSKEMVPCGMAATMGIWVSTVPDIGRFRSYVLCMVQILENVGNLGTGNIIPSSPRPPPLPSPPASLPSSSSGGGSRIAKIAAGSVSGVVILVAGVSFLVLALIRRRKRSLASVTTDLEFTVPIDRPLPTEGLYIFTMSELKQATSGFHSRNLLGEGGAGKVYLGTLPSGQQVAIKRIHRKKRKLGEFYREVEVVAKLRHRKLTTLVGYCLQSKGHALVYEYMPGGNLSAALSRGDLPWRRRLLIAGDVAEALAYLHDLPDGAVVHRDVKPTNVLLAGDGTAKLSDFGVSKVVPPGTSHVSTEVKGTRGYLDPEYFGAGKVSKAADVYSFGVMLLQLLTGTKAVVETPSGGQQSIVQAARAVSGGATAIVDHRLAAECDGDSLEEVFQLACRCVKPYKDERPRMADVLSVLRGVLAVVEATPVGPTSGAALTPVGPTGGAPFPSRGDSPPTTAEPSTSSSSF
ncbi:unnamed protein product [Spirodela intermedia]|uniref:Protein kinase domain-containing protein n=1 Tax=Spirodela intermedia TaxID=51605 RepID=A0A7I8K778_SPIIN|nr:unnamed protein product [Spirodela intermedia]CAB1184510.1 unnamed protein product [Spirodela intermedia]